LKPTLTLFIDLVGFKKVWVILSDLKNGDYCW